MCPAVGAKTVCGNGHQRTCVWLLPCVVCVYRKARACTRSLLWVKEALEGSLFENPSAVAVKSSGCKKDGKAPHPASLVPACCCSGLMSSSFRRGEMHTRFWHAGEMMPSRGRRDDERKENQKENLLFLVLFLVLSSRSRRPGSWLSPCSRRPGQRSSLSPCLLPQLPSAAASRDAYAQNSTSQQTVYVSVAPGWGKHGILIKRSDAHAGGRTRDHPAVQAELSGELSGEGATARLARRPGTYVGWLWLSTTSVDSRTPSQNTSTYAWAWSWRLPCRHLSGALYY